MFTWLQKHLATILVSAALVLLVAAVIRSMYRAKKQGRSTCGCNCAQCSAGCHLRSGQ